MIKIYRLLMILAQSFKNQLKLMVGSSLLVLFSLFFSFSAVAQITPVMHKADQKTFSGSGTSVSISRPDNVAEDDLIVLIFSLSASLRNPDLGSRFQTPAGFTMIHVAHDRSKIGRASCRERV